MQALHRGIAVAVAVTAIIGFAAHVDAAPQTFNFTGEITFIHDYLDLDDSVHVGAPFHGSYTFDAEGVVDEYPDDPQVGSYYFGLVDRLSAKLGIYEFETNDLGMFILNDRVSGDLYQVSNGVPFQAAGYYWLAMSVVLGDRTRKALDSDRLVTEVPDLADFPTYHGLVLNLPGGALGISAHLTSLTPEPSSLLLALPGAAALVARRRR